MKNSMGVIRITKEFSFEMSHALEGYDGLCSQIHGHSYRFFVTVKGRPEVDRANPKLGMVMDFGVLKKIVNDLVVNRFDHSLVLRETEGNREVLQVLKSSFDRIITVDYQPTCENMISYFAGVISAALPDGIELHSLRLHETATSFAEWFAEDNMM